MKRRRLPIPQHEFGFSAETFTLTGERSLDGERIARELAEVASARAQAARCQPPLFAHPESSPSPP